MAFINKLGKEFVITGEIEPDEAVSTNFLDKARKYQDYVDAINATDAPLGKPHLSSIAACKLMQDETGMEAIAQMCCRDRNIIAIKSDLLGAKALGINNVVCLTGDYAIDRSIQPFELDSVRLSRLVKEEMTKEFKGFSMNVGVAYNPMSTPNEPEQIKLAKKMKWADFVQTQPVYDLSLLENDIVQKNKKKIIVGIMPLLSTEFAQYFNKNVPGFRIPGDIAKKVKTPSDGVKLARETALKVKELGYAGVHLMVFKVEDRIPYILKGLKD